MVTIRSSAREMKPLLNLSLALSSRKTFGLLWYLVLVKDSFLFPIYDLLPLFSTWPVCSAVIPWEIKVAAESNRPPGGYKRLRSCKFSTSACIHNRQGRWP